ncbi:MAG: hypothetical protein J0H40_18650 [Rhizobiales bacterium]|nr:hypothetical protein [Hyphomicrobiales bacterium]
MSDRRQSPCNVCGRDTDHDIVWQDNTAKEIPDGSATGVKTLALRCRGCGDCSLCEEEWYHDGLPYEGNESTITSTRFKPPRLWRRTPDWLERIESTDPELFDILVEIYSAANPQQVRLLSVGVRTALDHLMIKMLGGDFGSFEQKLDEMVTTGHLTSSQRDDLAIVVDAGSASSHRGFKPPRELLEGMLMVMEGLVRDYYVTGPMLKTAKASIPPKPPRQRRSS